MKKSEKTRTADAVRHKVEGQKIKTPKERPTAATAGPSKELNTTYISYHSKPELSSDPEKVKRLKEGILACITQRGSYTTFAELSKYVEEFNGGCEFNLYKKYPNLILWTSMSEEAIEAILQLDEEGRIVSSPVSSLVYIYEGADMSLPIAKRLRGHKKPYWLPLAMCRTCQPANKQLSHTERVAELGKVLRCQQL